jgi:hypothetical protein
MTTKLHVLLGKDHHLQARLDYCHSQGAKYAGDVDKASFGGRLFFGFSCRRIFSSSSRDWLSSAFNNWCLQHGFC